MQQFKTTNLSKIRASIDDLVKVFSTKPALVSAMVLMAVLTSFAHPLFSIPLLLPLLLSLGFFPKNLHWVIFFSLVFGIVCHICNVPDNFAKSTVLPTDKDCGILESILPRSNGNAFIIYNGSYRVRLLEKRSLENLPQPGDSICYEASWYPINPVTVPGAFDTENWLRGENLAAYGKLLHWKSHKGKWIPERSFHQFRSWIKHKFDKFLLPAETGLLLGLLAGDKSGIPEALRNDFQRSGLVHVLAISGFHVVLLAGMLMIFLKATGLPHKVVCILAIILLWLYVPITGNSPAVRRAVIMFTIPQLGTLLQRTSNVMNSLGFAILCILIPNPLELWNPGFQLSFAATAGILIGGKFNIQKSLPEFLQKNPFFKKFHDFAIAPTYVTLCATIATSPFLIHHFKTLSPFAWLGNIVIVPAISWGMQAGLFALLSPIDFLSKYFCSAASFLLRIASLLTRILSSSTEASVTIGPFGPWILLIMGTLFLALPICRKNYLARIYAIASILFFSWVFLFSGFEKWRNPSWTITMIDVGQGDSILITTPSGKNILIDAGPNDYRDSGKDIIVPFLHHIGVFSLDALVVSHPDSDHYGGVLSIVKTFPVKQLWISSCARIEEKKDWILAQSEALERGTPIKDIQRGFIWKESLFEIRAVHPNPSRCAETNEGSITLWVSGLGHSGLFTGDLTIAGEKEILANGYPIKSEILKVGHHGSKTSSSRIFLEAVSPQLALISSGRKNKFRHPHKQVTDRLDSLKIPYLNTATSGTITIKFTPTSMEVNKMLDP